MKGGINYAYQNLFQTFKTGYLKSSITRLNSGSTVSSQEVTYWVFIQKNKEYKYNNKYRRKLQSKRLKCKRLNSSETVTFNSKQHFLQSTNREKQRTWTYLHAIRLKLLWFEQHQNENWKKVTFQEVDELLTRRQGDQNPPLLN